ncbi:MAG: autotransporter outer membrane beta-barrel domain-containing protein, partial [Ketobacteraceae bacterium]|nr:autotransporter outer membrane beta-barrel domain-containing protein [Ketobacteraceae bacterium]
MQILKRLPLFALFIFGFVPAAMAVQVGPFTTSSYTTDSDNARIIPITTVLSSSSVTFETADAINRGNLEAALADNSVIFEVCESGGEICATTTDTVSVPVSIPEGTINLENNNIVFRPTNPDFAADVSFFYGVFVPASQSSGSSTLTIEVQGATISRSNMLRIDSAITSFCDNNSTNPTVATACTAFNSLAPQEKIDALSTISPEEVVAEFTSTLNMTKDQTGNLANRLNALRGGATGLSLAGLNYIQGDDVFYGQWLHEMANQIGGNAGGEQNFSRLGFFINGSITDGEKDTTSLEQGYDLDGDSITFGADYRISNTLIAGVAYGISDTEIEFASDNEMTNEIDNLLFYGSWFKDQFYLDGVLGYASGDIETKRRIQVGSIDEVVDGETESSQVFFSITGNYDFIEGPLTYGPYASLDYIDGEIDGYEEVGTTGFEVGFADQDIKSQVLTFGGRVQYAWSQPWGIVMPHARAEWKTELEDDRDAIVGRFVL